MTKTRFLAFLTALALLLTIPTVVFAQSTIPHQFTGTANLDGPTAVDGTAVTAWVDGKQVQATNIVNGSYAFKVGGIDGFFGETVIFKVAAATADQTADWERGGATTLNLTASSSSNSSEPPVAGGEGAKGDQGDPGPAGSPGSAVPPVPRVTPVMPDPLVPTVLPVRPEPLVQPALRATTVAVERLE